MKLIRLTIVAVALAAGGAWWFYFVGTDHPAKADAIVVLSGDLRRVPTGVRLFDEHVAPNLLISLYGAVPKSCGRPHVMCFHAHPLSTRGEAETVARMARAHGWKSIIIVSSRYHLRRARMLFARCTDARLQVVPSKTSLRRYMIAVPLELAKWAYQLTVQRRC
ncbi:MAG: YdcF family protein [Gaiellaceae bacterium]